MYKVFDDVTKEQLIADFKTVVSDAEALLKATANHGGEELAGVRSRAEESIMAMKAKMADEQAAVLAFSKDAAKAADVYVHLYPWTAVGVAAGVGLVVGLLKQPPLVTRFMAGNVPVVNKGLLESLTSFALTLVALLYTRLNLASTELDEYRSYVVAQLVLALVALFFMGVGVVLATILLVVAFWDTDRLLVLGSLAGFYLAVGLTAATVAMHKARTKPRPFAASLSELYKDRQQLAPRS